MRDAKCWIDVLSFFVEYLLNFVDGNLEFLDLIMVF